MSPTESSASEPADRRRRNAEAADPIAGLVAEPPPRRKGTRRRKSNRGRITPLSVLVGALAVAILALVGVVALRFFFPQEEDTERRPVTTRVYEAEETTEVLSDREVDTRPLVESELFERGAMELESQGITFTLEAHSLTENCAEAVWGERPKDALASMDCSQTARAGYVSDEYVGMAALFNLADTEESRELAQALQTRGTDAGERDGFVALPSEEGPLGTLGTGYSIAEVTVNGHYLLVLWTQSRSSTSASDHDDLAGPIIALSRFEMPLYRRLLEHDTESDASEGATSGQDGAGVAGTQGPPA